MALCSKAFNRFAQNGFAFIKLFETLAVLQDSVQTQEEILRHDFRPDFVVFLFNDPRPVGRGSFRARLCRHAENFPGRALAEPRRHAGRHVLENV